MSQCPGQDARKLTVCFYPCPSCGYKVEMFSDEMRRKCPKCKEIVHRDALPTCIQWCGAAKDCIGEAKWEEVKELLNKQGES